MRTPETIGEWFWYYFILIFLVPCFYIYNVPEMWHTAVDELRNKFTKKYPLLESSKKVLGKQDAH